MVYQRYLLKDWTLSSASDTAPLLASFSSDLKHLPGYHCRRRTGCNDGIVFAPSISSSISAFETETIAPIFLGERGPSDSVARCLFRPGGGVGGKLFLASS